MMHRRRTDVLLGFLLAVTFASLARAQGPVYRERWGYLHLENRRADVLRELAGRGDEDEAKVAALLASPDKGLPFVPVAQALAHLRGVACDEAFVLRASLGTYVLPEVVDPDASVALCQQANFSVFLPYTVPVPGAMTFELIVRDAKGKQVWTETVTRNTKLADVRMAQAKASMPSKDLADGEYEVELRGLLDGENPRATDPVLKWSFYVLRGYQERVESALNGALAKRDELPVLPRALLDGLAAQVSRAYSGEAFSVRSQAVRELQQLERALSNLDAGDLATASASTLLAGLAGQITTALPGGELAMGTAPAGAIIQPCVLRLPPDDQPHPLVIFVTGTPAYDTGASRPTAPVMREATWLAQEMREFGRKGGWHAAFIDSPGGGRPFADALLASIRSLPQVFRTGGQKPLLVCDREAAAVVGMRLDKFAPLVAGVALVGGGGMPSRVIAKLGDLPVRFVRLEGYPGSRAIGRMMDYIASQRASQKASQEASQTQDASEPSTELDLRMLHQRELPWLFGVPRSAAELHELAVQVFGQR